MATIQEFANGLTGWFLRTPIFNAFRDSAIKPLDDILSAFYTFRTREKWLLNHNSQIVYLEHFLNVEFGITYDVATRDADITAGTIIWIESANDYPDYLYNKIESRPPLYLYNKSESLTPKYFKNYSEFLDLSSFIIWIPIAVTYDDAILKSLVDFYKLSGKTYTIQTY